MNLPRNTVIALGVGIALLALTILAAFAARPDHSQWWTDGDLIRVPREKAPIREVLWRPAQPLKGAFTAADEYEPRYSADATLVIFVRNRPNQRDGQNADLYTSRWSPSGWSEPEPLDSINTPKDE